MRALISGCSGRSQTLGAMRAPISGCSGRSYSRCSGRFLSAPISGCSRRSYSRCSGRSLTPGGWRGFGSLAHRRCGRFLRLFCSRWFARSRGPGHRSFRGLYGSRRFGFGRFGYSVPFSSEDAFLAGGLRRQLSAHLLHFAKKFIRDVNCCGYCDESHNVKKKAMARHTHAGPWLEGDHANI